MSTNSKTAYGYPTPQDPTKTPQDTTKGFGSYDPWNEAEQQQYLARDVLHVVQALLAGGMQSGDVSDQALISAGALLDAALAIIERQGFPAWKDTEAQLAQLKANAAAARKQRRGQNVRTEVAKGA